MGTRFLALACGIGLASAMMMEGAFAQSVTAQSVTAQSVTVVRGGTKAEPGPSSVEIVRGRNPQPQMTQAAVSGLAAAGHASFIFTPGDVAVVNCPEGDGASRVSCRVRIAPPERKRGAF